MIYARVKGKYMIHASEIEADVLLEEVATLMRLVIQDISVLLDADTESVTEKAIEFIKEGLGAKYCTEHDA